MTVGVTSFKMHLFSNPFQSLSKKTKTARTPTKLNLLALNNILWNVNRHWVIQLFVKLWLVPGSESFVWRPSNVGYKVFFFECWIHSESWTKTSQCQHGIMMMVLVKNYWFSPWKFCEEVEMLETAYFGNWMVLSGSVQNYVLIFISYTINKPITFYCTIPW